MTWFLSIRLLAWKAHEITNQTAYPICVPDKNDMTQDSDIRFLITIIEADIRHEITGR